MLSAQAAMEPGIQSSVALDKKGNVYGTTMMGGADGYGTVFKLTRKPDGHWSEKILQNFRNGDPNGQEPWGGVILDDAGNLFGTTILGGAYHSGTAFEMVPSPTGWTFGVVYDFCSQPGCSDGGSTEAGLTLDGAGNLYGASNVVYQITPAPDGWSESMLYTFCSKPGCFDGGGTYAGVIFDAKGNLYGTTGGGGTNGVGTVFKLRHMPDGTWEEHVLHSFGSPGDGRLPASHGNLALDSSGSLYGTTSSGGTYSCGNATCGTVFRLSRQPSGHWKETILHDFKLGKSGYWPGAGVVIDPAGNLYGTAGGGGTDCDCGVVYRMSPKPDGTWNYTVLHRFTGSDGAFPDANLTLDDQGNVYGTTLYGGPGGGGVVFEITP